MRENSARDSRSRDVVWTLGPLRAEGRTRRIAPEGVVRIRPCIRRRIDVAPYYLSRFGRPLPCLLLDTCVVIRMCSI